MYTDLLQVRNVVKHFGGVKAVNGVSFSVARSEIHGLIGPNKAGKTTIINLISGLLRPSQGEILVDGHHIEDLPAESRARMGVARTFVIGGFGSLPRAVLGGFLLGIAEVVMLILLPQSAGGLVSAAVFTLVALLLIWRPGGILSPVRAKGDQI